MDAVEAYEWVNGARSLCDERQDWPMADAAMAERAAILIEHLPRTDMDTALMAARRSRDQARDACVELSETVDRLEEWKRSAEVTLFDAGIASGQMIRERDERIRVLERQRDGARANMATSDEMRAIVEARMSEQQRSFERREADFLERVRVVEGDNADLERERDQLRRDLETVRSVAARLERERDEALAREEA